MLDFERWFQKQGQISEQDAEEKLFNALEEKGFEITWQGKVECACCVCDEPIVLSDYITREECLDEDPKNQYCGGSPRCLP